MTQLTCTPSGDDWNTPNIGVQSTTQEGTYSTAGKDGGNPSTWVSSGSTPDKTDFDRAYATSRVVNGHFYVYVAWERSSTTGTQGYAIEIDNSGSNVGADGTPQPNRSSGGAVFYISSQGSSAPVFDSACTFTSQSNYGTTCTSSSGGVVAAINTASISDPLASTTQAAGSFFEVALDVTFYTGITPSCPGAAANSVYLRSITGQTHNGNLKGYMAPLNVAPASTCVVPPIDTTATPGNSTIDGLQVTTPGSSQHDVVTVGTAQAPGVGTVKFFLCQPNQVTAGGCEGTAGTQVGSAATLDANGQATSGTINGGTTPNDNANGTYCWRAEFTPSANDHHYLAGKHTNTTTECFKVAHADPTIATQSSAGTGSGAATNSIGFTALGDTATLSGVYADADLSAQNVTFKLYGPLASAPGANDCTAGALVYGPVTASLTKVDSTTWKAVAPTFTPTAADGPGYYTWIASYAGDDINASATGACGAANETQHLVGPLLTLTKGTPHATITAGDDVVYDINLGNVGEGTASGVVVTDVLPILAGGGTWSLAAGADPSCSLAAGTGVNAGHQVLTCTIGQLDPSVVTQIAEVSAATTTADCGDINNTAALAADPDVSQTAGPVKVHVQCPHLTITKKADADSVSVGSDIGFTVTVTNDGAGTATGVVLSDPLPTGPGISWHIDSATGPLTCTDPIVGNTLQCTGSLAQGAAEVVHVVSATHWNVDVNSCTGSPYDNTAHVSAGNALIDNPEASASEAVLCPNIHITKLAEPGDSSSVQVTDGTSVGWKITGSNDGQGTAKDVVLTDNDLPAGLNWSIASQQVNGQDVNVCQKTDATTLTCSGFDLAPGDTIVVSLTAPTSFSSCGTYDNTASLSAGNTPQKPEDSASVKVVCANITVVKTADHTHPVNVGSDIGFSLTISNSGDGDAHGVTVSDVLPTGPGIAWTIDSGVSTDPLTCGISGHTLTCTGDLAAGDSASVHVISQTSWTVVDGTETNSCLGGPGGDGVYPNTAAFSWSNGPDGTFNSNEATETVQCPDLTIVKSADAASVSAGDSIGFSIEVTNAGPGTATGATIHDDLPGGTDVIWGSVTITNGNPGASCALGGSTPGSQTLDCDLGDLGAGADVTIHLSSATTAASCGVYDNTATLTTSNAPGSDSSASTSVLCPDITLTKDADAPAVNDGDPIGFTLTVSNADNPDTGTGHDVALHDALPGGPAGSDVVWTIDPVYAGPGTCAITGDQGSQVLDCAFGSLAPNTTVTVHLMSNTSFVSCGDYPNSATESASNDAEHTATATTSVICPVLDTIDVVADDAAVPANKPIGFTLSGQNDAEHLTTEVTGTAKTVASVHKLVAPLLASSVEPGTVVNAVLVSALPASNGASGTGIHWSIAPDYSGPGSCAISGPDNSQVLTCQLGNLAPQEGFAVHIVSDTSCDVGGPYVDKGTLSSSNVPDVSSQDSTFVNACAAHAQKPSHHEVASTGTPLLGLQLTWGIGLVLGGGLVLLVARRRRSAAE